MRFANVGAVYHPVYGAIHFDIDLNATSSYTPSDVSANGFVNGRFAQVNLACGESVDLRATLLASCATAPSCRACEVAGLSTPQKIACYAAGCSCVGTTVYYQNDCRASDVAAYAGSYCRAQSSTVLMLPAGSLATLSVFDLDTSSDGQYIEQITVHDYEYFKTPLRASSGADVTTSVFVNPATRTFTGTQPGSASIGISKRGFQKKGIAYRSCPGRFTTRWRVLSHLWFVQRRRRSPLFTKIAPGIGWGRTQLPSGRQSSSPGLSLWARSVRIPLSVWAPTPMRGSGAAG